MGKVTKAQPEEPRYTRLGRPPGTGALKDAVQLSTKVERSTAEMLFDSTKETGLTQGQMIGEWALAYYEKMLREIEAKKAAEKKKIVVVKKAA